MTPTIRDVVALLVLPLTWKEVHSYHGTRSMQLKESAQKAYELADAFLLAREGKL
jgi:hypothetical protein